jgi:hypothetical protein
MSEHAPGPCQCRYEVHANRLHATSVSVPFGRIVYCPMHAAAPDLLAALEGIRAGLHAIQPLVMGHALLIKDTQGESSPGFAPWWAAGERVERMKALADAALAATLKLTP